MSRGLARLRGPVVAAAVIVLVLPSAALADRAFTPRFSTNANGDIAIVGNTLETCQTSVPDCANARAGLGTVLNNNNFSMVRVNTDAAALDSSSARLSLPAGARVLFAGLYYGSRTNAGTTGKSAPDSTVAGLSKVDLKPPGASGFDHLTASVDLSTDVTGAYDAFVDITGQVQRAGSGVYTVANVQSATGDDRYAGWALVVAYEAAGEPPRNLTVFDGLASVTQGKSAITIPVSGFQTPLSGPVRTKLGFVAYEGDRGLTGDSATLDGKLLSDKLNASNNMFNSVISNDGQYFTDKTPDYVNQLGFDAKRIGIDGFLANGATNATIGLKTSSDQYLPQVITFASDLYAPVVRANKTVVNLTHPDGPTLAGDKLRYTVTFANDGLEAATNFVATDKIPPDTTYVAGTLRIPTAPASAANPTDLVGDDQGEYDTAQQTVRFFLGSGAAAGRGGTLAPSGAPGSTAQISFDVRREPDRRPRDQEHRPGGVHRPHARQGTDRAVLRDARQREGEPDALAAGRPRPRAERDRGPGRVRQRHGRRPRHDRQQRTRRRHRRCAPRRRAAGSNDRVGHDRPGHVLDRAAPGRGRVGRGRCRYRRAGRRRRSRVDE
jgi:uncharacterized repeat protein (TIGR01451 family)